MEIDMRAPDALGGIAFGIPATAGDVLGSFTAASAPAWPCAQENGHRSDPMECDDEAPPPPPRARAPLRMDCDFACLADHDEDALFCHSRASVVGVADGVGGCRGDGVDAAEFSHGLMENAFDEVEAAASSSSGSGVCPYTVLERAYQKTAASTRTRVASTALILSLAGRALRDGLPYPVSGYYGWAYVGDSAFAVFRGGRLLLRSRPQQHYFNCPFQLSGVGGDRVSDAAVGEFPVEEGDVVVAGTDGLFDNVFDATLEGIVRMGTVLGFTPGKMADAIAGFAYDVSRSNRESPFSAASREERGTNFVGGKRDDITVIVGFIVS